MLWVIESPPRSTQSQKLVASSRFREFSCRSKTVACWHKSCVNELMAIAVIWRRYTIPKTAAIGESQTWDACG